MVARPKHSPRCRAHRLEHAPALLQQRVRQPQLRAEPVQPQRRQIEELRPEEGKSALLARGGGGGGRGLRAKGRAAAPGGGRGRVGGSGGGGSGGGPAREEGEEATASSPDVLLEEGELDGVEVGAERRRRRLGAREEVKHLKEHKNKNKEQKMREKNEKARGGGGRAVWAR